MIDVRDVGFDFDFRVNRAQVIGGGDRLWQPILGVAFSKHGLPLEIGRLHEIAIDDPQPSNTGAAQCLSLRRSQRAAADN